MLHSTIEPTHSQAPHSQEPSTENVTYHSVAATPQYQRLRSGFLRFAFPMTIAALVSYFAYVLASIYAVDWMKQPFAGLSGLTLGMALGLAQFAIVWVWTAIYVRFANTRIDPTATTIKAQIENGAAA